MNEEMVPRAGLKQFSALKDLRKGAGLFARSQHQPLSRHAPAPSPRLTAVSKIDIAQWRAAFRYCPETGAIVRVSSGRIVGAVGAKGYVLVRLGNRTLRAHRLAWALFYNSPPPPEIDHANLDRADNRIVNLRAATRSQNQANTPARPYNTTGLKGVTFNKQRQKYRAQIHRNGRQFYLGCFDDPIAACEAYRSAANEIYAEFARSAHDL